jgi:hypothetical protein
MDLHSKKTRTNSWSCIKHGDMVVVTGYPVMVMIVVAGAAHTDVCIVLLLIDMFDSCIMMNKENK